MSAPDELAPSVFEEARARIQQCRDADPEEAKRGFVAAMNDLIAARNRALAGDRTAAARDPALRQLNAILSLMASIEFPQSGLHRKRMDQVVEALARAS
jgi:hypothetical protein